MLGLLSAVAVAVGSQPVERTFLTIVGPTQSIMSTTVAFLGVFLVLKLGCARPITVMLTLKSGLGLAALITAFGVAVSATLTAIVASSAGNRWQGAGQVALGSLLVQGVAMLNGTGLGLLLRRPLLACTATFAPLGLWWLLGAAEALRPAQPWLTVYPSVQRLLSAGMTQGAWAQWLVVLVIWGLLPNTFGILRAHRKAAQLG